MAVQFTILVIDDDPAIVDFLRRAAQKEFTEASFVAVSDIKEAIIYLDKLESKAPQLILLDINLREGKNGLEFLTLIRNHEKGRLLPVVVLSGSDAPKQIQQAYALGAAAVTRKPFEFEEWKAYTRNLRTYWFDIVKTSSLWGGLNIVPGD